MGCKKKLTIEEQVQREVDGAAVRDLLIGAGLPKDYPKLNPKDQRLTRMRTLTSWFDPSRPDILVSDVDALCRSMRLWVEFYYKPAEINRGRYYYDDPTCKPDMIRDCMSPPKVVTGPAKIIMTATRRMGKTETFIQQLMPMMAICRPWTGILMSQINDRRTKEELGKVKAQIEGNDYIQSDFGGEGILFPTVSRSGSEWSGHHLKFLHHRGSEIVAHSLNSSQRGRGPIFGVIDDPEDEDNTYSKDFRRWLFDKILRVYVRMFRTGGVFLWIGTPIHKGSCLSLAMRGSSEEEGAEDEIRDKRFNDFRKVRYPLIISDDKGGWISRQPQGYSVNQFLHDMELDSIGTRAEILCEPVTPGDRVFSFGWQKHGYMHCEPQPGTADDYYLDLYTGVEMPWQQFKDGTRNFGAGDLADGSTTDDDAGALIAIGIDPKGVIHVMDAFIRKCRAEVLIETSAVFATVWGCEAFAWEKVSFTSVINRMIARMYDDFRKRGLAVPPIVQVDNAKKNKIRRILTMVPLFGGCEIRFPHMETIKGPDDRVHTPVDFERRTSIEELIGQVEEYTDVGIRGPDDGIDALEMAVRIAGTARGVAGLSDTEDVTVDEMLVRWQKTGLGLTQNSVPLEAWSPKMREEAVSVQQGPAYNFLRGVVPYV